ncbi:MAG: hypothetical protein P1U63_09560 [Coxiellaceae bacterium]|nr:hypothetical protein [Coxiellaceae bacterium]
MKIQLIAAIALVATVALPLSASAAAKPAAGGSNTQQIVQQLQSQIKQVQGSIAPAISAQAKVTQKQIQQLQSQTQTQFKHMQDQLQQLQDNLIKQIQKVAAIRSGTAPLTPLPAKKK